MMGKPKRKCLVCRRESSATVSLLQFPRGDATVLPQWLEFCEIGASDLSGNSRICSQHFTHDCFKSAVKEGRRVTLKNGAVPTILRDEPVAVAIPTNTEGTIQTDPLDINHNDRRHRSTYVRKNKEGPKGPVLRYCYICGTVYTSSPCISFFRFPKDVERRRTWMESLGIEEAELCDSQRLCSQHFPDGSKYNVPVRHLINLYIDANSSGQDFKAPDLQTPRRKRRCLNLESSQIIKYKTRINELYLENKRMHSKITKLEQALTTLHDNGLLSDCATDTLRVFGLFRAR